MKHTVENLPENLKFFHKVWSHYIEDLLKLSGLVNLEYEMDQFQPVLDSKIFEAIRNDRLFWFREHLLPEEGKGFVHIGSKLLAEYTRLEGNIDALIVFVKVDDNPRRFLVHSRSIKASDSKYHIGHKGIASTTIFPALGEAEIEHWRQKTAKELIKRTEYSLKANPNINFIAETLKRVEQLENPTNLLTFQPKKEEQSD